jgi:hypothetical protein
MNTSHCAYNYLLGVSHASDHISAFYYQKKSVAVNFIIHDTLFDYAYKLIF